MPSPTVNRLRFLALCIAIMCRVAAYAIVTVITIKSLQKGVYSDYQPLTLMAWLALCSLPALILTPLIGPIASSRLNRVVLIGGSAMVVGVVAWASFGENAPWLSVLGGLSFELAFSVSALFALVPVLAATARVGRVMSLVFGSLALVGGIWVAAYSDMNRVTSKYALILSAISLLSISLGCISLSEPLALSRGLLRPFVEGATNSFGNRRALGALIGLWMWFFVLVATLAGLLRSEGWAWFLRREAAMVASGTWACGYSPDDWIFETTWLFTSTCLLGVLVSTFQRNPYRHGGLAFFAAFLAAGCCLWLRFSDSWNWPFLGLGFALGLALPPLLHFYQTWTTPKYHGIAASLVVAGCCIAALTLAGISLNLGDDPLAARTPLLNILAIVTVLAALGSIIAFFRPGMEGFLEFVLWPVYRVKSFGPGVEQLPPHGPYLVIANHSAWLDPLFMAKILPAPTTPMMTSKFYDLPVISWLMRNSIGTIRVPDITFRHDAPELREAVAALDAGKCVVVFAEGYLRRKEEQPLRRFGRGAWKILSERPNTPVFACWIEGNWGSYFSHRGGPPMKGKHIDFWRKIHIGVVGPIMMDPAVLQDHMATRTFLMQQVTAARLPLGLAPLELPMATERDKE